MADRFHGARALTLKQPWAFAIECGIKTVENRSWPIPGTWAHPGPLLIHAGKGFDAGARLIPEVFEELAAVSWPDWPLTYGAFVAIADRVTCHRATPGCCAPPFARPDCWHWVLDGVEPLEKPVPATGRQRLWRPDPDLLTAIEEASRG